MLFSAPENEITLPRPADDGGWVREKLHSAAINLLDFENFKISNLKKNLQIEHFLHYFSRVLLQVKLKVTLEE